MKKLFVVVLMFLLTFGVAHAQLGNLGNKLKKGINALTEEVNKSSSSQSQSSAQTPPAQKPATTQTYQSPQPAPSAPAGAPVSLDEFTPANIPANATFFPRW